MTILETNTNGKLRVYESTDKVYLLNLLIGQDGYRNKELCDHLYELLIKYPTIIKHISLDYTFTPDKFNDDTCLMHERKSIDELNEIFKSYEKGIMILDDFVTPHNTSITLDMYKIKDFIDYDKLNPLLRKFTIDTILKDLAC